MITDQWWERKCKIWIQSTTSSSTSLRSCLFFLSSHHHNNWSTLPKSKENIRTAMLSLNWNLKSDWSIFSNLCWIYLEGGVERRRRAEATVRSRGDGKETMFESWRGLFKCLKIIISSWISLKSQKLIVLLQMQNDWFPLSITELFLL